MGEYNYTIDDKGRLNLSRRDALIDLDGMVPATREGVFIWSEMVRNLVVIS